jgi:teichuronic acid biosynthesis glycosyltransferase TuaC
MKILFVSSGTSIDGISPLVLNQGKSLVKQGVEIDYFTINSKGLVGYFCHILKLRKYLGNHSYDIIHAHYGLSGLVAITAKSKKQKMIISFMGSDLLGNRSRNGKRTIFGNLIVKLNQRLALNTDFVIVKSNQMAMKVKCNRKSIIPNGVNLTDFYPMDKSRALEKSGWNKDSKHIFFMADPNRPEKNFKLFREAFNQLLDEGVELHVLKILQASDVVYYYNASDVCVLTSYHEGSPNVIKEAMACNRAIISTNVGDVKEVFSDTKGCYISSSDQNDLVIKIKEAIKFSQEKGETHGRKRIIELGLDSETVAKRIVNVYEKVLDS